MSHLPYLYAVLVALAALLGAVAIGSRRALWLKAGALGLTGLLLAVAYAGLADLLSKPKPVRLEWLEREAESATVLAAALRENRGIYLWLQLSGTGEPRAYILPWSTKTADELMDALRESEGTSGSVEVRRPFDLDYPLDAPRFYVTLRPLPTKKLIHSRIPTYYYDRPEGDEGDPGASPGPDAEKR